MPNELPVGPYRTLPLSDGASAPWYILTFDKEGNSTSPLTRRQLLDAVAAADAAGNGFTDIYLFCHGWNNDWAVAMERYEDFITGYRELRANRGLQFQRPYRPLLIGIIWPSTALVLPWERGPHIAAAANGRARNAAVADEQRQLQELAEVLPERHRERFYEIAQSADNLSEPEATELADMLRPLYDHSDSEVESDDEPASIAEVLELWREVSAASPERSAATADGSFGFIDGVDEGGAGESGPQGAGVLGRFDPRSIVRVATVLQMKDRGGVVGENGVAPLLDGLLGAGHSRLHLIGHSYGCKVLLSGLCSAEEFPRAIDSLLLLQPAVSRFCFARTVPGRDRPGGYRVALERVRQPIMVTWTEHDMPLRKLFHLAARRGSDLGEMRAAAEDGPSRYAALGGYGPAGCDEDCRSIDIQDPEQLYDLGAGVPDILVINGTRIIDGHSEISKEAIWWALYSQVVQ